jgi:hypothetical protein
MIWQWIKQGAFSLETYKALRVQVLNELRDPLSHKSDRNFFEATRVLDGLILNRYITEDAKPLALQWLKG